MATERAHATALHVTVRGTMSVEHGHNVTPDHIMLGHAPCQVEIGADNKHIHLKPINFKTPFDVNLLCEWWAGMPTDYDRNIGPSSIDNAWVGSRLWQMIDPTDETLLAEARSRRQRFLHEHVIPEDDVGLAMLAMYDAANGQRDARNWSAVARIVGQMNDLLHRSDESQ
jgi:hypothetical protein